MSSTEQKRLVPCMGGWCKARETCANFWAGPLPGRPISERLCAAGQDEPEPIVATKKAMETELHRAKLEADPRFAAWAMLREKAS